MEDAKWHRKKFMTMYLRISGELSFREIGTMLGKSENLALLVLVLSMCLERLIRLLSDYESFVAQMHMDSAVLVAETAAVCMACGWHLWFAHKKISKEG